MKKSIIHSNVSQATRMVWIDFLRALAMFFVVLVHASNGCSGWWIYNVFIGPVMLPLFFSISGYLFNDENGDSKVFYKKLFKRSVIPWLFLSLIWLRAVLIPIKGLDQFASALYNLVSGKSYWFMPAFIISEIIYFYVYKLSTILQQKFEFKRKTLVCCLIMIFLCALGLLLNHYEIGNFAMINRALIAQGFLLIGYLFRNYVQILTANKCRNLLIGIVVYIVLGLLSLLSMPNQYMDVHRNMYQSIPLCFLMIFVGNITLFIASYSINKIPKTLLFFGQNTLVCYMFHSYGFGIINKVMTLAGVYITISWPWAFFKSLISIAMCTIGACILNYVLPEANGRKRTYAPRST